MTENDSEFVYPRLIRLTAVRGAYWHFQITEAEARLILRGCIKPGDEATRFDDSAYLLMTGNRILAAFGIQEFVGLLSA